MASRSAEVASASSVAVTELPGQAASSSSTALAKPKGAPVERNVQWVDMHGYELAQVREFEPRCVPLFPPASMSYNITPTQLCTQKEIDCFLGRELHHLTSRAAPLLPPCLQYTLR
jgi:hypothetical protein